MGEGWRCSWEVGFLQMLTTPVAADFSGGSSCSGATKVPCSDDGPVVAHKLTSCCYVSSVLFSLLIKWSLKRNTAVVLVDHDSSWWYEVRRRSSWVNGCCINKLVKHLPWYIMYFTSVKFIFLRVLIVLYIECYGAKWWCTKDLNMCNWISKQGPIQSPWGSETRVRREQRQGLVEVRSDMEWIYFETTLLRKTCR